MKLKGIGSRTLATDIAGFVRFPGTRNNETRNPRLGTGNQTRTRNPGPATPGRRGLRAMLERKKQLAEQQALERDLSFFGRLADAVHNPATLARGLCHKDAAVRYHAARAAAGLAENGFEISGILPQLAAGLSDEDRTAKAYCAWALGNATRNGADISKAVPALGAVLLKDDDALVRGAVCFALCAAGENGADLLSARDALMAASNDSDGTVRRFASDALFCLRP